MISDKQVQKIINETEWIIGTSRKMPFLVTDLLTKAYTQSPEFMKGFALRKLFYIYSDEFHKSYRDKKDMSFFTDRFKELFNTSFKKFFEKYREEAEYEIGLFNKINSYETRINEMDSKEFADFVKLCNINVPLGLRVLQYPVFVSILKEEGIINLTEKEVLQLNKIRDKHAKVGWYFVDIIVRSIIKRFSLMFNISEKQAECITLDEIIKSIKQNKLFVPSENLSSRNKLLVIIKDDSGQEIFVDGMATKYRDLFNSRFLSESSVLSGRACFPGKLKGKIVRINDPRDLKKIKEGNIIAAYMTTVHFTPYMKKVKAILTEEGGYSCHAVIIAREFKKPCIVGIKHLMNSVKDGDIVEVNAEKGIVRVVKE